MLLLISMLSFETGSRSGNDVCQAYTAGRSKACSPIVKRMASFGTFGSVTMDLLPRIQGLNMRHTMALIQWPLASSDALLCSSALSLVRRKQDSCMSANCDYSYSIVLGATLYQIKIETVTGRGDSARPLFSPVYQPCTGGS